MPAYKTRAKAYNDNKLYKNLLTQRGDGNGITQYRTILLGSKFKRIATQVVYHVWSTGDRYYKLSNHYYNSYEWWWVIALYNNQPTEANLKYGDVLEIPLNPAALISEI
tara:strand:+ start:658 stop:984 length:327 start_codon:yes stop_codon:yes gene_type:complete